jgi:hypothetical protein
MKGPRSPVPEVLLYPRVGLGEKLRVDEKLAATALRDTGGRD